jgi:hypothetical protein
MSSTDPQRTLADYCEYLPDGEQRPCDAQAEPVIDPSPEAHALPSSGLPRGHRPASAWGHKGWSFDSPLASVAQL